MNQQVAILKLYGKRTKRKVKAVYKSKVVQIEHPGDLQIFQDEAYKNIGVRFPIDFLYNSRTFVMFNRFGKICGGFCLASASDSRVVESLPDLGRKNLRDHVPNYENELFEITGLWLNKNERSRLIAAKFWLELYKEMIKEKKSHFIYAYSSEKPKLGDIYSIASPKLVFRGFTKMLPGMTEPDHEVIEVGSMKALYLVWIKGIDQVLYRLFKTRTSNKRKMYA